MKILLIGLITILAGMVQAVTGFGSGIVNMLFFAKLMPLNIAPSVSEAISIPLSFAIFYTYRKYVKTDKVILPAILYSLGSSYAINMVKGMDLNNLKIFFGLFLMFIGVFNLFLAERIKIKGTFMSTAFCSLVSGVMGGMFGIGGPIMVIYYLAITETKEEYLGTINCLFTITSIYRVFFRIINGLFTAQLLPYIAIGLVGIMLGKNIGAKFVDKIDGKKLKRYIYIFLVFAGFISVVNTII